MQFLERERSVLEQFLPGLDQQLAAVPLEELECRQTPVFRLFREANGPALVIPAEYGGLGADPVQAVRLQRAIGSRAPSLAVATTMHHSSVAAVVERCVSREREGSGMELLLEAVARQRLLLASGFAEGRTGTSDFIPLMKARQGANGLVVSGSKKPCSLTWSMDFLTASVRLPSPSGQFDVGVILVPADAKGLERRLFWRSPILAGAESDEIILHGVEVPEQMIFHLGNPTQIDEFMLQGLLWFELLVAASYLGAASALVERALAAGKGEPSDIALLGIELEGAMAALEGIARAKMMGRTSEEEFVRALFVRYALTRAVERATALAFELLGGMAFVRSFDAAYLYAAARALAFHPPSRTSIAQSLTEYMRGAPVSEQSVGLVV